MMSSHNYDYETGMFDVKREIEKAGLEILDIKTKIEYRHPMALSRYQMGIAVKN